MKRILKHITQNWSKYLLYLSLFFVVLALAQAEYLKIPKIHKYFYLFLSFVFLFAGFIFQCLNWHFILKDRFPVSFAHSVISFGLYVFSKYIPGKVLVIVGKAAYINQQYEYPTKSLIVRSLDAQFMVLWTGLMVGSAGLFFSGEAARWALPLLLSWLALTLVIFTNIFHRLFQKILKRIAKKEISIPFIRFREALRVLPVFFGYWLIFAAGFYFFAAALCPETVSFGVAFGFPLAITLGIMALIAPGGIGIREGVLVAYLTMLGIDLAQATTISVASRLWFLLGEIFIFSLATALKLNEKSKKTQ